MDRFYRALRVLCIVAIATGALAACLVGFEIIWYPRLFNGTDVNLTITSPQALYDLARQPLFIGNGLLESGACVMGIVLAWLDRRKRWLVALIIVTFIAYVGPNYLRIWQMYTPNQSQPGGVTLQYGQFSYLLIQSLPSLIAVVTTLAFARDTQQERMALEAELGITRSAI